MNRTDATPWGRIWAVFLAGVAAAFLIGKAPAALPVLRAELGLSLFQAGLVVSMFSLIAATTGTVIGAFSDRLGARRLSVAGLVIAAIASALGAQADTAVPLIASRVAEGIGFFMASVSLPAILIRLASDRARAGVMGLWGSYLPAGSAIVLLAGGAVIAAIGWHGLWLAVALALAVFAVIVWVAAPPDHGHASSQHGRLVTVLKSPGPVLQALVFGFYSGQYLAVTAFVPLILVERAGWSLAPAAAAGALVMAANVTGNVAVGPLLGRGISRAALIVTAAAAMAAGATILLSEFLPPLARIAGAVVFSSFGGLIPGSLFAGVTRHAPTPRHVATVNGLMLQGVAIGQLIGPALTTWLVGLGGTWAWGLVYVLPMAGLTAIAGLALGRLERRQNSA